MLQRRDLIRLAALFPLLGASDATAAAARRIGGGRILLRDGRVWIQVAIAGAKPMVFIIDTGAAANLIRQDVARQLKLNELGEAILVGVGGPQRFTLYDAPDVVLGGVRVGVLEFAAYPPETLSIHRDAAGAMSASMLTVVDTDLDFERSEWRVYPDGRGERPDYVALPSEIFRGARRRGATPIYVDAMIGDQKYRLEVDTGAPRQVYLFGAASRRSGLWSDATPFVPGTSAGIGGEAGPTRLVRAADLRLGSIRFEKPLVMLREPQPRKMETADGLIGIELLQLLNLSTDVKGGRLWAARNGLPVPPERYALTGLRLDEVDGKLMVIEVSPQSPAADAGLHAGDELIGMSLKDFRSRTSGRPGERVEIMVRSGGASRSAILTLRAFV